MASKMPGQLSLQPTKAEMQTGFRQLLDATVTLQRFLRRRRWFKVMGSGIPLVRTPCNLCVMLPVYNRELELLGVEGTRHAYMGLSLHCLGPINPLRLFFIAITESAWFDRLTLTIVLLNCVDLAVLGPPSQPHASYHDSFEMFTTYYFTVELLCKVIAMGFAGHDHAYLGDPFNQLDFVVVLTAWLPLLFPQLDNFSAMRAVRALRPLRTINQLPELRREVETLLASLPQLLDVALLSAFILVVFGVLGVQLFAGSLRTRCYESAAAASPIDPWGSSLDGVCGPAAIAGGLDATAADGSAIDDLREEVRGTCRGASHECRVFGYNPMYETVSFDDIGSAWMTIFQCVTLEGWTGIMYMTMRAVGPIALVYYLLLVVLGSFYLLNLFLAVMWHVNNRPPPRTPRAKKAKKDAFGYASLGSHLEPGMEGEEDGRQRRLSAEEDRTAINKAIDKAVKRSVTISLKIPSRSSTPVASMRAPSPELRLSERRGTVCERFVNASLFQSVVICLIVGNTVLMTLERYPMPDELDAALEQSNAVVTLCFAFEMTAKHCAFGARGYWSDGFNCFDGLIVITSLIDVISTYATLSFLPADSPAFGALRVFRLMRVFRVFRLVRSWTGLRQLLGALLRSLTQFAYLMLLVALFLFIYALLGMQLFGGRYEPPAVDETPRANFESITFSMITVFIVATSEGWEGVWQSTRHAVGGWSAPFFVSLIVLLNFIMLNLVVATLIGTFDMQAAEERKKRLGAEIEIQADIEADIEAGIQKRPQAPPPDGKAVVVIDGQASAHDGASTDRQAAKAVASFYRRRSFASNSEEAQTALAMANAAAAAGGFALSALPSAQSSPAPPNQQPAQLPYGDPEPQLPASPPPSPPPTHALGLHAARATKTAPYLPLVEDADLEVWGGRASQACDDRHDHALCLFGPDHCVRRRAAWLVGLQLGEGSVLTFDNLIITFIVISSVAMAMDSCELDASSLLATRLRTIDHVAIAIFVGELLTKVLAYGLLSTPNAYLKDGWNRLDFVIVLSSIVSMVGESSPAFRVLRMLRVLRPLRLISRFKGMRTAVQLLLRAMPRVLDVAVVYCLFLLVFSILGVQLFAGKLGACHDENSGPLTRAPSALAGEEKTPALEQGWLPLAQPACDRAPHVGWANPPFGSFDNTPSSMLLLFEMSTLEGWTEVMFATVDATAIGEAPQRDAHPENALFFILWIVLGSMLLLNLFVGVLVNVFGDIKRQEDEGGAEGIALMTDEQRQWVESMENALDLSPKVVPAEPTNGLRRACYRLVRHKRFEMAILGVILFNTALMALDGYHTPPVKAAALAVLNNVCTAVFLAEAACKITAVGCPAYLADGWNVFDFSVVLISITDWVITYVAAELGAGATNPTLIRILRMVRITRILRTVRMVRSMRSLRLLLSMLLLSLPALSNVLGIFLIMLFMYSLLAMQLFGHVAHGEYLNEDANFCTFGRAALTLFRCATGESWNGLMHDARVRPESGRCSNEAGDCGSIAAVPFFVSYVLLSTFCVLKMMIVLILENYLNALKRDRSSVKPEDAEAFLDAWARYDPDGRGLIPIDHLVDVVQLLPPPLGLHPSRYPGGVLKRVHVQRYVFKLQVRPVVSPATGVAEVPFKQLLACIVRDAYFDKATRTRLVRSWTDVFASDSLKESRGGRRLVGLLQVMTS